MITDKDHADVAAVVTAVIPTFNRAADLRRALLHLAKQTSKHLRVVVVDNSSTDGTDGMVSALMPAWGGRLTYLRKEPEGPAAARNAGLAAAESPFVLYQDSDVALPAEWVEHALRHMAADPRLAAVGGYVLYAFDPSRVNAYGGDMSRLGLAWDRDEGTLLQLSRQAEDRIWINCSAMLARSDTLRRAGGFDEAFFYGYEDSDLGWRLNLMGYRVAVFPDLAAMHHVDPKPGVAHPDIVFHYCKNRLRSILKNASATTLAWMLPAYLAYALADLALRAPRRPKSKALAWNIRRLAETRLLRRAAQMARRVPDAAIFRLGTGRWLPATPLRGRRRRPSGSDTVGNDAARGTDDRV